MATTETRPPATAPPTAEPLPAGGPQVLALVRIAAGLVWLANLNWKTPPDFGENGGGALYGYTKSAVDHPVIDPWSFIVDHVVLPNFRLFGWATLLVETCLAAFLILGLATRLWALIGALQSAAIGMSVAFLPGEWPWSYYMMIAVHLALFATAAGRKWSIDEVLRPVLATRSERVAYWLRKAT
jgi:thiosulfate dehydrogenase [quinone] large subunit